ncbi:MarR family transcriptional regulator [Altererythrobacter salegens]|uniref:MarR family transcriptional regulator n=1 Tax=Croceibacterium salegens TaxID=1737568 RepID=A0A6I4SSX0_9SPHN|nr:MarR family winged helix-turn-helix transcriptional regulator [Croceibacterium salegens]MXO58087.1 MarR family transcriptional regulator [Croceibacterium salegens]
MKQSTRLSDFLPYRLSVTSNAVSGRISQEYRSRFGLSIPEWRVMAVLGDAGGLTQRDLTRLTLMDKVAVNRACKVLEERQLVVREPNASDGRSHLLKLTPEGVEMHSQIMPLALDMERHLFARFSEDEVDTFRSLLVRVLAEAEELDSESFDGADYGLGAPD